MTKHETTVRTPTPTAPPVPSLQEDTATAGQLAPIAEPAAAEPTKLAQSTKQRRVAQAGRQRRTLAHGARFAVRLVVAGLALTLAFTAGIGAGSFLFAWIAALAQGSGAAVRVPVQTGTILGAAGVLAAVALGVRYGAERFSKYKYPHFSCEACKGGGKDFEPRWLRLLRWGRRRAWRKCPACDGKPTENR